MKPLEENLLHMVKHGYAPSIRYNASLGVWEAAVAEDPHEGTAQATTPNEALVGAMSSLLSGYLGSGESIVVVEFGEKEDG